MRTRSWSCPSCGASSFVKLEKNMVRCPYCHAVYLLSEDSQDKLTRIKPEEPGEEVCPVCGEKIKGKLTHRCPYCMREGICAEHFVNGICSDCVPRFEESRRKSETVDRAEIDPHILRDYVKALEAAGDDRKKVLALYDEFSNRIKTLVVHGLITEQDSSAMMNILRKGVDDPQKARRALFWRNFTVIAIIIISIAIAILGPVLTCDY